MRRRGFVAAVCALGISRYVGAQVQVAVRRIALFDDGDEAGRAHLWKGFRVRLEELGFVEGANLAVERRWGGSSAEGLPRLAAELVAARPELIVTNSTSTTRAILALTSSIPVVFTNVGNPVGSGLVASLARPGANATGLSILGAETHAKRLELLGELLPVAKRFGFLGPADNRSIVASYQQLEKSARAKRLVVRMIDAGDPAGVGRAFESLAGAKVEGLVVASMLLPYRREVVELAARHRVPAVYAYTDFVESGGLIAYGPDLAQLYRRAADYVHRILRGAKPADLPVEQPTTLSLAVNLQTARSLGIAIPQAVLLRADRVIE